MDIRITPGTQLGSERDLHALDPAALCRPVLDYYRSQETKDPDLLGDSVCELVYRLYCGGTDRLQDWEPWTRLTRGQIVGNLSKAFAHPDYHYQNAVECTHIKLNGDEALVRAVESGRSWKNRTWENAEALWHVTPDAGGVWRIAGHVHRLP